MTEAKTKNKTEPKRRWYVIRATGEGLVSYENKAELLAAIDSGQVENGDEIFYGHLALYDISRTTVNGIQTTMDLVKRK